jgi:hypothetical protein
MLLQLLHPGRSGLIGATLAARAANVVPGREGRELDVTIAVPKAELAPYALVRVAALAYPRPARESRRFRAALDELVGVRRRLAALAGPLADALHGTAGQHPTRFHQRVVLPLRRAVHNGRPVRPALVAELGDLTTRLPALRSWLDLAAVEAAARVRLAAEAPTALAAERATLAALCRTEAVRRGVTLVGDDLLYGIDRVAAMGSTPTGRARKGEPNAVRYALRASVKTSPLSWFSHVAWGEWSAADAPQDEPARSAPLSQVRANRTLLARLLHALRAAPDVRRSSRFRAAPALRVADGRVTFRRDVPVDAASRVLMLREEEAAVALTRPVALLLEAVERAGPDGVGFAGLAAAIATRLGGPSERVDAAAAEHAAAEYVHRAISAGLLTPTEPVHPQDPDALGAVAGWLDRIGRSDVARWLGEIRARERDFGALPATARVAALDGLRRAWRAAFDAAGAPWQDAPALTEDVVIPGTVRIDARWGRSAAGGLVGLTALAELFDAYLVARRLVRNHFVARYGVGGQCRQVAQFAVELREVWAAATAIARDGTMDHSGRWGDLLGPDVAEVADIRAAVMSARVADPDTDEVRVPDRVIHEVERALPRWTRRRPTSYAFFVQPADGLLVVNHVYSGWGRFTSRFLPALGPRAQSAVARQLRRVLGGRARLAQVRPVLGYNANLHPLLVEQEVGEDLAWADIGMDQLHVHHDPATDQVRLRHTVSGEQVDVLYLGFLMPLLLPARLAPLVLDLSSGPVDFGHLATTRDADGCVRRSRVRYRDVVLARRSWSLTKPTVADWRANLDADGPVPADAAAAWIARLGLPTNVFVASGPPPTGRAADVAYYAMAPKPQYVDLANALHLRCLSKTLARHADGVRLTEALPVPGRGIPRARTVELVAETYRSEHLP